MALLKIFIFFFLIIKFLHSEIPNLENRDKEKIKKDIVSTYIRSMNKWDIPFQDLLENRSGSACINWRSLDENFLKSGMFDALGYSQNIPNKKASQIAAVSGCNKMKEYYKLGDSCTCEVIISNDNVEIILPVKIFDMKKEFEDAVLFYKKNDYNRAIKKFEKLSDMGDAKSQYNLAVIFYKGLGTPQNFKRAYYWSMMSNLYGQKEAKLLSNKSEMKINKTNKNDINTEIKDNLEKKINEGETFAIIPLAKWYLSTPKKPDYNNAYLWLSVASAFDIENTSKARNMIFNKIKKNRLDDIQNEANEIYTSIINLKNTTQME